ncbi:MAG: AAA-like domain-containing protein, partial [Candidatus Poribacteria bacterium]
MSSALPGQHEQFYVVGGNLHPDAPSYVRRQADDDLYDALSRGEFCYILTSRQMGKSSLIVRTGARLAQDGVRVVTIDLTGIGQNLTPEQWYSGLLLNVGERLDLEDELEDFWEAHERLSPVQRFVEALHRVVLQQIDGRVVVFLDEIDVAQSLPFSPNEFFAAIRHCYTRRAEDPDFERLSFCLAGVATPSDLIDDPLTTPFNIGTRIELTDFAEDEAGRLAAGFDREDAVGESLIRRVLHWTNGHPYLTQRMCQAVQADGAVQTAADVDRLCEELFFSERAREQEPNLQFVRNQMLWRDVDHAALLSIYGDVRNGKHVANDETNPLTAVLRLAGVVRVEAGALHVRNPIYAHVFDGAWVRENMPDAGLRRLRVASRRAMLRSGAVAAVVIALLGVFAGYAVVQRNEAASQGELATAQTLEAVRTLAVAQADKGRMMLRDNDTNGLLYLAQARETADGMPKLARSISEDWTLWHWQLDGRLMQVFGHDDDVTAMAFSPDGDMFITGSADGTAQLWDTATGAPRGKPLAHGSRVGQEPRYYQRSATWALVCFNSDASLVAVGGDDGTITVWDTDTTDLHLPRLLTEEHIVNQMAFRSDGSLVAYAYTAERHSFLWRWDMSDGSVLLNGVTVMDVEYRGSAILSADGSRLLPTNGPAVVDAATGKIEWRSGRSELLSSAASSESHLAVGYFSDLDYLVQVFDWQGNPVHSFLESSWIGAWDSVHVEITPDGRYLVTVTHEG